jgi:hypothetical protein
MRLNQQKTMTRHPSSPDRRPSGRDKATCGRTIGYHLSVSTVLRPGMIMSNPIESLIASFPSAYKRTFEDFCVEADYHSVSSSDEESVSGEDSEDEREEDLMVKSIVSAAMAQPRGSLAQLLDKQLARGSSAKKQRVMNDKPKHLGIHSASAPELNFASLVSQPATSQANFDFDHSNPDKCLKALLSRHNISYKTVPSLSVTDFFTKPSESYDLNLIQAVRTEDLDTLRLKTSLGQTMQCANQFGHTLLHTAARRGATDIVRFFLTEANDVTPKVVCDMGRTPLHDACWTASPNFEIIEMLLDSSPDLLFLTDIRGFTPMAYVPKEHWQDWCFFLEQRGAEKLQPRELF